MLDVALSPDGKRIYAVASTKNQEDTLFRVGTIGAKDIKWGDVFTICDLKIVTLATTAADPDKVYGIAHKRVGTTTKKTNGDGLYRIDPAALADGTQPVLVGPTFNSIGHLRIHPKTGKAWASEGVAGGEAKVYTGVRVISNVASATPAVATIPFGGASGKDDIAVWAAEDGAPARDRVRGRRRLRRKAALRLPRDDEGRAGAGGEHGDPPGAVPADGHAPHDLRGRVRRADGQHEDE